MKLIGLMPVRNEDWVLGLTARAALMWCDGLVILDHASTDHTGQILNQLVNEFRERVSIIDDSDPTWHEMNHRQRLLDAARKEGATHITTVDADELLTGNLLGSIREMIEDLGAGDILRLPWLAMGAPFYYDIETKDDQYPYWNWPVYLTEGPWAGSLITMAFKDDVRFHWSAEVRDGYDFHRRHPLVKGASKNYITFNDPREVWGSRGGLLHLQFLSRRRLRAKQALYQMVETLRWPGRSTAAELAEMYGRAVHGSSLSNFKFRLCDWDWLEPYRDLLQYLDVDAEPWQEAECKRLVAEHGREKFAGLDLFGVV